MGNESPRAENASERLTIGFVYTSVWLKVARVFLSQSCGIK